MKTPPSTHLLLPGWWRRQPQLLRLLLRPAWRPAALALARAFNHAAEPVPRLFFLDGVLDAESLAALKTRFNGSMLAPMVDGRHTMAVPGGVTARLTTALRHRRRIHGLMDMGPSVEASSSTWCG